MADAAYREEEYYTYADILETDEKTVGLHILDNGRYVASVSGEDDEVPVSVLPGCTISLRDI
jgi:hypothetical protein